MHKYIFVRLLLTKQDIIGVRLHLINWKQTTLQRALINFVVRLTTFTDYTTQKQTLYSCTAVMVLVLLLSYLYLCLYSFYDDEQKIIMILAFFFWMFVHMSTNLSCCFIFLLFYPWCCLVPEIAWFFCCSMNTVEF